MFVAKGHPLTRQFISGPQGPSQEEDVAYWQHETENLATECAHETCHVWTVGSRGLP